MKKQYSNKLGNKKQARKPLITALEPRLLLDGAAVATAVDVLTDSQLHDASQTDNSHLDSDTSFVVAPTEVRAVDPSSNNGKKEVVFIEDNVADYQSLIDETNAGVEVVLLDSTQDGLSQMAEWAKTHSDYDAIHLISHGSEGQLNLGGLTLDASTVNTRSDDLAQLGAALNEEGDLLLYGCSVANGEGQNFIEALAQATQADVAASDDLTGAVSLGGDWLLEKQSGVIETTDLSSGFADNYAHTLETITFIEDSSEDTSANNDNSFTRTISGAEFTFAAGSALTSISASYLDIQTDSASGYQDINGGIGPGIYALSDRNGNSGVDFSIKVENGYTFDLTGFDAQLRTGELSVYYVKYGVSGTQQKDFSLGGTDAFQAYSGITDFNDITEIVFTSENFGLFQNLIITDVKAISANNAPTITGAPTDITVTEDTASNIDLSAMTFADGDGDNLTVTITASAGTLVASSGGSVVVSGSGTGALTLSGSAANINSYLDTTSNINYTGAANASGNDAATLSIKANDGTVDSATSTVNIDITAVNDAPTAVSPTTGIISTFDVSNSTVATLGATDADDTTWKFSIQSITLNSVTQTNDDSLFNFATAANTLTATNVLRATTPSGLTAGEYVVTVRATDSGGLTTDQAITITVTDSLVVTTSTISGDAFDDYATEAADGGGLDLEEALHFATSGKTVGFDSGLDGSTITLTNSPTVAAGVIFDGDAVNNITITGNTLTLSGLSTVTNGAGDTFTINSILSGTNGLTKTGAGTLILGSSSNSASLSGTQTVSAGVLSVAADANLGSGAVSLGGGTLQITGATTIDNAITMTADSTVKSNAQATLSGVVSGAHTLTSSGSNVLTLSNISNTLTGLDIASGYVVVSNVGSLGDGTTAVTLSGGGLQTQGALSFSNSLTLAANSTLETGDATTWSGAITGSATLTKAGAGNLTLLGANSGSWGLTMSGAGGLTVTDASNLGTGTLGLNTGGFHVTGPSTFSNAISLIASSTITADAAVTLSGQISGASKTLTKAGAGTMTLSGSANGNSSWNTTVSAGTLKIGAAANIGTGAISLAGGTTLQTIFSSSQELSNAVTLNGNATIQTDASNNSRLTLSGTVSGGGNTLTKSGSGILVLSGTNSGTTLKTTVTAGNLMISSNANLGSGELTLNGGTLYLQSASAITHGITLGESGGTILVAGADVTVSGDITGSGALTKGGGRVLTLGGSNNFSGGFNIAGSAGGANVIVADGSNLGDGAVTLTKGLQITGSGTITNNFVLNGGLISNANGVTLSGEISGSGAMEKVDTGVLILSGASNSWSGTTTVSAGTLTGTTSSLTGNIINNAAVEFSQSTAGEYSKVISGTGTVTKSGSGILTLSGVNTYTGSTTVSSGGLTLVGGSNIADTSAVTLASAATLTLSGGNETIGSLAGAGNVVLGYRLTTGGNNTDTTFSGVISSTNTSGITKTGSGIFTLSGTNTYTGATTVSAGTLMVSSGSAIADASAVTVASGATFELDASVSETVGSIAGAGSIVANGGTLTVGGDNSSTTFSGVMSERADALNLVKLGSGTLTLSGSNTYAGTTTVSGGTLSIAGDSNLGSGTLTLNSGTLSVTGNGANIDNAITLSNSGVLNVDTGIAATFSGLISGTGGLLKTGAGTATLSANNTYTGATSLNAGTLSVTGALVATSGVTVNSGATLGGSGSVFATSSSNTLTVNNGGFLAPGVSGINSGAGALTVNGNLILNGTLKADIAGTSAGTGYDQVIVKGDVTLGANSAFDVTYSTSASGSTFVMIDNQGANAVTGTLSGLAEGGILASGGSRFITSYLGGNGNDITQKAISTPVVSVVDVTGAISEGSILTDSGSITFTDSDASSRPTATATVKSVTGKGQDGVTSLTVTADQLAAIKSAFSISSAGTNTNNGAINWSYSIAESNLNFLKEGETVVAVFTITLVNDNSGTSVTQDITVTIKGTNDVPMVTGSVVSMTGTSGQVFTPVTLPANLFTDLDSGETSKLVWSVENLPTGMVFNAVTHTISGIPRGGFEGVNTLQIVATDPNGGQVKVPVTLTLDSAPVTEPIVPSSSVTPPTVSPTSAQTAALNIDVIATTLTPLPPGTITSGSGVSGFAGDVIVSSGNTAIGNTDTGNANAGNNGAGSGVPASVISSSSVAVNVGADGRVQVTQAAGVAVNTTGLTVATMINQVNQVSITLADTGPAANYSGTLSDGSSLPNWVQVNPTTGEVTMTPPLGQGKITLKINAVDANGNARVLEVEVDLTKTPTSTQGQQPEESAPATGNGVAFISLDEQLTMAAGQSDDYGSDLMKLLAS